jgi:ribosomal-protein-alanine N-acetyltransferase
MKPIILETDRLIIRPFTIEDAEDALAFCSNPETVKNTGDVVRNTVAEVKDVITNVWLSDYEKYGHGRFAIIHKADNKIIGFNGLKHLPYAGGSDIGYRLLPEYWGKGIATESSLKILEYAFNDLKLDRVLGFVYTDNPTSSKILKKLGFRLLKIAPYPDELDEIDVEWYDITKKMYEGQ